MKHTPDAVRPLSQTVARLREQLRSLEAARRPAGAVRISTGCEALDRLLPAGGLGRGTLVEWLAAGTASGAGTLALTAAREACRDDGPLVVIDGQDAFYPPAAALAGIDLDRLIIVRATEGADEVWALDQVLRSAGVGAVLCWSDRLGERAVRRLQLAAESGAGLGLLVRPESARCEPCWAEVRLLVRPLPLAASADAFPANVRRFYVELLRARGGTPGSAVQLEIDDETGVVRLAAELAAAVPERRA